jgi:hypothetical protein
MTEELGSLQQRLRPIARDEIVQTLGHPHVRMLGRTCLSAMIHWKRNGTHSEGLAGIAGFHLLTSRVAPADSGWADH